MWEKISFIDFPDICRLCLSRTGLRSFFETPALISICNVIANLKIKEDDCLPKNVCGECSKKIEYISDFIEMCRTNHNTLSAIALHEEDKSRTKQTLLENIFQNCDNLDNENIERKIELEIIEDSEDGQFEYIEIENGIRWDHSINIEEETPGNRPKVRKHKLLVCKYCGRNCASKNQLEIHLRTHTGLKPYKCETCPRKFAAKYSLQRHKIVHNNHRPHKCNICDWSGRTVTELQKHEEKHSTDKIHVFESKVETESVPIEKNWKCLDCGKFFTRKFDLQLHLRIHSGYKPHQCNMCEKRFTQKHTLIRHITSVHLKNELEICTFQCYICDRKFIRKDNLEAHMLNVHIKKQTSTDLDSKPVTCTICNRNFSQNSYLCQHNALVHENSLEKIKSSRVRTKIKNIRFTTTSNLCPYCGISFEKRKSFQAHMSRKHSNKERESKIENGRVVKQRRQYQCWHCGKIFHSLCNLKTHVRTHTGEKPYECKYCHLRFAAWNSWHEHENIHTGVKPYQCEFCKKGFRHRSGLRKHLKSSIHRK